MLSVIIPTNNSESVLVPTLSALVPGAVAGVVREVIIVDAGSGDGTPAIADAVGCVAVSSESVAGGLRTAAAQARGPWLMFLRPGFIPEPHWIDEVRRFAESPEDRDASAATFRGGRAGLPSTAREIFALMGAIFFSPLCPKRGLLISKRFYAALDGHRDDAQDPEADLMRRIGRGRLTRLACGATMRFQTPSS